MGHRKTLKFKLHARRRNIHDNLPDEDEDFDAIVLNARKKLDIPVEPAMPCVAWKHIPTAAKTQKHKFAVSKVSDGAP